MYCYCSTVYVLENKNIAREYCYGSTVITTITAIACIKVCF